MSNQHAEFGLVVWLDAVPSGAALLSEEANLLRRAPSARLSWLSDSQGCIHLISGGLFGFAFDVRMIGGDTQPVERDLVENCSQAVVAGWALSDWLADQYILVEDYSGGEHVRVLGHRRAERMHVDSDGRHIHSASAPWVAYYENVREADSHCSEAPHYDCRGSILENT